MSMTRFVVLRHGETHWNTEGRMQGHLDSELTPLGERQVALAARELAGETFEHLISSDLGRTLASARALCRTVQLPIGRDAALRERHLGAFQGLTLAEARASHPEDARRFSERDPEHQVPGGESVREVYERVAARFEDLARMHAGARVLVVTHGGVLDVLYRHARGLPLGAPRDFALPNAGINRLEYRRGQWQVLQWAAVDHLQGSGVTEAVADSRQ